MCCYVALCSLVHCLLEFILKVGLCDKNVCTTEVLLFANISLSSLKAEPGYPFVYHCDLDDQTTFSRVINVEIQVIPKDYKRFLARVDAA